jgi:hypothetical protein
MLLPRIATIFTDPAGIATSEPPLIELWDAWAFAEIDAEFALKRWWDAGDAERASAYAAYQAALERETQAAAVLEMQVQLTSGTVRGLS